jgi:hypothetical protein
MASSPLVRGGKAEQELNRTWLVQYKNGFLLPFTKLFWMTGQLDNNHERQPQLRTQARKKFCIAQARRHEMYFASSDQLLVEPNA